MTSQDRDDDVLSFEEDFSMLPTSGTPSCCRDGMSIKVEDETHSGELGFGAVDEVSGRASLDAWEVEANIRRIEKIQHQILRSYDDLRNRSKNLEEEKQKILRYKPGAWIEKAGCLKLHDYEVPRTTTLVLFGPRGSGKSSLINRISKVFEEAKHASARAQVSYNPSIGDGTTFLREYMIPRESTSFCLYDSRGLSHDFSENQRVFRKWVDEGVRHGELITWDTDGESLRKRLKEKDIYCDHLSFKARVVNFMIFVVDGLSILKCTESAVRTDYEKMITSTFNSPWVSYQDDKPVVVFTHGDLLSLSERARVRARLGELLGVPPTEQIFDIPDSEDPETQLAIVDMLCYSLEHAERNFPVKIRNTDNKLKIESNRKQSSCLETHLGVVILTLVCVLLMAMRIDHSQLSAKVHVDPQFNVYDDAQLHANISHTSKNHEVTPQMEPNTGKHANSFEKPEVIPQMETNTEQPIGSSAKPEVFSSMETNTGQSAASSAKPEVKETNKGLHAALSVKSEGIPQMAVFSEKPEVIPPAEPKVDGQATCFAEPEDTCQDVAEKIRLAPCCIEQPEEVRQVEPEKNWHAGFFARSSKRLKRRRSHNAASFAKRKENAEEEATKTNRGAKRKRNAKEEAIKINWVAIRHLWYDD